MDCCGFVFFLQVFGGQLKVVSYQSVKSEREKEGRGVYFFYVLALFFSSREKVIYEYVE